MKKNVSILLLLFSFYTVFAQKNIYVDALIVKTDGDSILSHIIPFTMVNFGKKLIVVSENGNKKEYPPNEVKSVSYGDYYYESIEIKPYGKDKIKESRFCEALVVGYTNLYKVRFSTDRNIYVLKKDGQYFMLEKIIERVRDGNEHKYIATKERYKDVLRYLTQDCQQVLPKINNLSFADKSLKKFVIEYNRFFNEDEIEEFEKKKRRSVNFYIGTSNGKVDFYKPISSLMLDYNFYLEGKTPATFNPNLGVEFEKYITNNLSFIAGLGFNKYKGVMHQKVTPNYWIDANINLSMLSIPIKAKLNLSKSNSSPYIYTGISPWIPLSKKYSNTGNYSNLVGDFELPVKGLQFGLNAGIGYSVKISETKSIRFNLEYSYINLKYRVGAFGNYSGIILHVGYNLEWYK